MYNIKEIPLQNQQDAWSLLYLCLTEKVMEICGRSGEQIIRNAVADMGHAQGDALREKHLSMGIHTNLLALYEYGFATSHDPRVVERVITSTEQVCLWEIYVCPMADFFQKANCAKYASYFCEEYQSALVSSYTKGKGQMNLSTCLTCHRDNHCRFSVYFRPSNTDSVLRRQSFESEDGEQQKIQMPSIKFADYVRENSIMFCRFLLARAEELSGTTGVCAVSEGLRRYGMSIIPVMKKHADDIDRCYDAAFYSEHFIFALDSPSLKETQAEKMLNQLVLEPIRISLT